MKRELVWALTLPYVQAGEQTFHAGLPEREARAESTPTRAEERLEGSRAGWALLAAKEHIENPFTKTPP